MIRHRKPKKGGDRYHCCNTPCQAESLLIDFDLQKCTRKCAVTGRELEPGDVFYSELVPDGASVVRHDYSEAEWVGESENAIGSWKSQIPDPKQKKISWAPNDVLLDYFVELEGKHQDPDVLYVLTLLLIRRRLMRLEAMELDEIGDDMLVVYCPRKECEYRVSVVTPGPERITQIQDNLAQLLFSNAP